MKTNIKSKFRYKNLYQIFQFQCWIYIFQSITSLFKVRLHFLFFRESFSCSMNFVYRNLLPSDILNTLGHFLLLERKFSYDSGTKPFSIYLILSNVFWNLSFQETKASSTTSCNTDRGDNAILNIFGVAMYTKLISRMAFSSQEKSSSTATLRHSCPRKLPKIPKKLFATQQHF